MILSGNYMFTLWFMFSLVLSIHGSYQLRYVINLRKMNAIRGINDATSDKLLRMLHV
jgi:hypothetical protein